MKIFNVTQHTVLAETAEMADTVVSRLKGLIGRRDIPSGHAMVITHCRSIHMFFMRFAIDVIFVDRKNTVVGLVENIQPFQVSPYFLRSAYVVELPPGAIRQSQTVKGDVLDLQQ